MKIIAEDLYTHGHALTREYSFEETEQLSLLFDYLADFKVALQRLLIHELAEVKADIMRAKIKKIDAILENHKDLAEYLRCSANAL